MASIMAMQLIAAHTSSPPLSEDVQFDRATALRLASETAGEFAAYDAAVGFRQQLLTAAPTDEENRIELIRLLAASGRKGEAIQNLAATIADRNATRTLRWQAVWLTPEIVGNDQSVWVKVRDGVRALSANDTEMNTALESLSLSAGGRTEEAIRLIKEAETNMPNEYLSSLHAILEKTNAGEALNSFSRALIAAREPRVSKSFGFVEDELLEQMIVMYLKQNQTRAALKVAEQVSAFQPNRNSIEQQDGAGTDLRPLLERYQTLRQRAENRKRTSRAHLLARLSTAAEQVGELNRALAFERLRLALVNSVSERNATQARVDHLEQLQSAAGRIRRVALVVDQKLVASE
jgi:tetratricopeptide (TPR) repeat protein